MASHSWADICPNCNKQADYCIETKPFESHSIWCCHCGFTLIPKVEYMNLEELNECRENYQLKPLKKIPKQREI